MLVELGNHSALRAVDDNPSVTTIHIPDPDENGEGGYSHVVNDDITATDIRIARQEAQDMRGGITQLGDFEAMLSVINAWPAHAVEAPDWVKVHAQARPEAVADDLEQMLRKYWSVKRKKPANVEDLYHTQFGPPGEGPTLGPPDITALFTNVGRAQQAVNYGGGQVGYTSIATASGATSLTCGTAGWTVNQWAGYRVYAVLAGGTLVWGNVLSNTATVLTVDRWYAPATPGGAAGSTPSATGGFVIADGGMVSAWFVGLSTTNIVPAASDTSLSGEYTTGGGGFVRKIAPYSLTSGTSPMTFTLTPVFTGNGSDVYPSTFYAIGVFTSMVVGAAGTMKFETLLNSSAVVSVVGDQISVTETITGS